MGDKRKGKRDMNLKLDAVAAKELFGEGSLGCMGGILPCLAPSH